MNPRWPDLDWADWRETAQHFHLMTQIVGKVRLASAPWLNHGWHVALHPTARGLMTGPIMVGDTGLQIDFDLIDSRLELATSAGDRRTVALEAGSIADFYHAVMAALEALGTPVKIVPVPNELPDTTRFPDDIRIRPWDSAAVRRFHTALLSVDGVFNRFRTGFLGKTSPVHFFWGSFDLAATRFSGRTAPRHPGGIPNLPDDVTCEAYSHEESSAGFWPGNDDFPRPAFYSYAYPSPAGFADAAVPAPAYYAEALGEWLLDYDAVRAASDPDAMLLGFLEATYAAAADLGQWDRAALECPLGLVARPRPV